MVGSILIEGDTVGVDVGREDTVGAILGLELGGPVGLADGLTDGVPVGWYDGSWDTLGESLG